MSADHPEPGEDKAANAGGGIAQLSLAELKQKVRVTQITVWEPHEDKNVTYAGFDIARLFAAVYGDQWRKVDEALFACVDGYQPVLPMERFKQHAGNLAFRRPASLPILSRTY